MDAIVNIKKTLYFAYFFAKKKLFVKRALTRLVLVDSCSVLDFYESYILFNNREKICVRLLNNKFT